MQIIIQWKNNQDLNIDINKSIKQQEKILPASVEVFVELFGLGLWSQNSLLLLLLLLVKKER